MRLDVVERVEREVIHAYKSIPKRGAEAGGLLLGRIETSDSVSIIIDDVAAVRCEYRRGPSYLLSESDVVRLEAELKRHGTSVVGFYRSHTRHNFGLDEEDLARVRTYLPGPASAFFLIKPLAIHNCLGNLFFWDGHEIVTDRVWVEFPFGKLQLSPEQVNTQVSKTALAEHPRAEVVAHQVKALESVGDKGQRLPESRPPAPLTAERAPVERRRVRWVPIAACLMFALSALLGFEIWKADQVPNTPSEAVTQSPAPKSSRAPLAASGQIAPGLPTAPAQPQQPLAGPSPNTRSAIAAHQGRSRSKKRALSRHRQFRKTHQRRRNSRA